MRPLWIGLFCGLTILPIPVYAMVLGLLGEVPNAYRCWQFPTDRLFLDISQFLPCVLLLVKAHGLDVNPNMKNTTIEPFPPSTKKDWLEQVLRDLRGKDFETTLTSLNPDNIQIQPYYAKEDLAGGLEGYQHSFHPQSDIPGLPPRLWTNVGTFKVGNEKVSNSEILQALMNGIDGILLKVGVGVDWDVVLQGVEISYIKVYLAPESNVVEVWESFKTWLDSQGLEQADLHGGILWDGFSDALQFPLQMEDVSTTATYLIDSAGVFPNFKPISLKLSHYHAAGATAVQELSYGFASLVSLCDSLEMHGVPAGQVFSNCMVSMEAGADFFGEIAKVKAARVIFHQLANLYRHGMEPENIEILVGTSTWTKCRWDLNTNMLRNTTEAMAAILGGCNALVVCTHDFSDSEFATRMARNLSNILKEESFFDKVIDPAAGSYYVEVLLHEILEKAKAKLVDIEGLGGWWSVFESTKLQTEIREARRKKMQSVSDGSAPKIGVNKYALKEIRPRLVLPSEEVWQLLPWRETLLFEIQNQDIV